MTSDLFYKKGMERLLHATKRHEKIITRIAKAAKKTCGCSGLGGAGPYCWRCKEILDLQDDLRDLEIHYTFEG